MLYSPMLLLLWLQASSHCIEHQVELVRHLKLKAVSRLLSPLGVYLMLVPDYCFCFDHFQTASTSIDCVLAGEKYREVVLNSNHGYKFCNLI